MSKMKKILVMSGKGGVGKSTIAVAITKALAARGYMVGILDIDVDTPNIPEFMGITDRDVELSETGIMPKWVDGIEVMSTGLMADNSLAIMWGGDRRTMVLDQMITKVDWTCEVLLIDSPPGTTEEVMTIIKKYKPEGIIIVSTDEKATISDVKRTLAMIKLLESSKKILGIVKNGSYIICAKCGEELRLHSGANDEDIDKLVIDEVPYILPIDSENDKVENYLENTISKIIEVIK